MSIDDGIAVREIVIVLIIHENGSCIIAVSLIGGVEVFLIILPLDNRITDIQRLYVQPAFHIRIDCLQRSKIHGQRGLHRLRLPAIFIRSFLRWFRRYLDRILSQFIVFIRSFFIGKKDFYQVVRGKHEHAQGCNKQKFPEDASGCAPRLFLLFFAIALSLRQARTHASPHVSRPVFSFLLYFIPSPFYLSTHSAKGLSIAGCSNSSTGRTATVTILSLYFFLCFTFPAFS